MKYKEIMCNIFQELMQKKNCENRKIMVRKIPQNTQRNRLISFFTDIGEIRYITNEFLDDPSNNFCYVCFKTRDETDKAMKTLPQTKFMGKLLEFSLLEQNYHKFEEDRRKLQREGDEKAIFSNSRESGHQTGSCTSRFISTENQEVLHPYMKTRKALQQNSSLKSQSSLYSQSPLKQGLRQQFCFSTEKDQILLSTTKSPQIMKQVEIQSEKRFNEFREFQVKQRNRLKKKKLNFQFP